MRDKIFNPIATKILVCFFLALQLFPPIWVLDVTSLRHFFVCLFDITSIGLLTYWVFKYKINFQNPLRFLPIKIWLLLIIYMLVSFLWAINAIESLATWNRWLVISISAFILTIFLTNNIKLFRTLVYSTIIISFINVLVCIIGYYYLDVYISQRNNLMLNGGYGNKNIFAVCLLFKLPLLYYAVIRYKKFWRYSSLVLIGLICFCLIIISTRSSFIGLFFQLIILFAYALVSYFRFHKTKKYALQFGLVILVALFGFFLGNKFIEYNYNHYAKKDVKNFYTVGARVKTIEDGNSKGRLRIWKNTIAIIKMKPITGYGVGNHKLAIMKVECAKKMDYVVSDHAHNDFLEMMSELGIGGELLYILLYASMGIMAIIMIMNKKIKEHYRLMALCSLMLLVTYMNDAIFNFPLERATPQIYLALSFALLATCWLKNKDKKGTKNSKKIIITLAVIIVPITYIEALHFKSSIIQRSRIECHNQWNPRHIPPEYWVKHTPWLPNIDESTKPLTMNNAMMFALDNRYRDAINLIINDNANPYYALKEYRLASYYAHLDMIDSSIYYADKCIKMKPLCYDPVMIKASIYDKLSQKDKQIQIMQDYLSKEQKEPRAWVAMIDIYIKMKNYKEAEETFEKAIKYNPNNPQILSKKAEIEKDKAEKVVENLN